MSQRPEISLRPLIPSSVSWLQHHSVLRAGIDGVILGARSSAQLESNLMDRYRSCLDSTVALSLI